ncbi:MULTISPECIES: hypothetical protein [unclassified Nonomuraea]|uniref:hypothetical protein n=1 Tax=unclassified Nonomuraea TaxID=2593643 RepID=UPI0033D8DDB2
MTAPASATPPRRPVPLGLARAGYLLVALTPAGQAVLGALRGLLEVLPLVTRGRYTPPGYTRLVTDKGFLLFALGGFLRPDPALLTLACWLVAVSAGHHWRMARTARLPLWHLRDLDAHRFLDGTLVPVPLARLHWLADRTGARPDLALVHTITEQAVRLADDVRSRALPAGTVDPQAALTAVLAARKRLTAVWDEIAATGRHGAEYAQLRRGDPVSFDDIRPMLAPDGRP